MVKLQGDESLSKEYMLFWQNFRKKGKKVLKGDAKDFLVAEIHKASVKFSGGQPSRNYATEIAKFCSLNDFESIRTRYIKQTLNPSVTSQLLLLLSQDKSVT